MTVIPFNDKSLPARRKLDDAAGDRDPGPFVDLSEPIAWLDTLVWRLFVLGFAGRR